MSTAEDIYGIPTGEALQRLTADGYEPVGQPIHDDSDSSFTVWANIARPSVKRYVVIGKREGLAYVLRRITRDEFFMRPEKPPVATVAPVVKTRVLVTDHGDTKLCVKVQVDGQVGYWAAGRNLDEALGNLVRCHGERVAPNIELVEQRRPPR